MDNKYFFLKNFIQRSVSLRLKVKRVPLAQLGSSCLAEHMAKFKMSIRVNLSTFLNIFPNLTRTQRIF